MAIPLRVLILEDDDDDAALVLRELRRGGYDPKWQRVCTPEAMSEALAAGPWDLVISDWSMPRWTGVEAFKQMRERGVDLPFIIVSGTISEEIAVEALRAGVHDFMPKGKFARLLPAIERELRDAEARKSRREAEAALEQQRRETERSERLLRLVLESVPDGVVVTDSEGRVMLTNPAAARLLGKPPGAVRAEQWAEHFAIHRSDKSGLFPASELAVMRALRGVEVDGQESFLPDAGGNGDGRFISTNARPLHDAEGASIGAVAVFRDVTREKASQEQLMISDRMASIGMLAAGVGHEINNPLTAVLGNLDLVRATLEEGATLDEAGVADISRRLQDAAAAAERVRIIVRDLKIFSRHQEPQAGPLAVQPVLESSLRMAWNEVRHRARIEKSFGPVPLVEAAESRLGQVFLNLIVNAAQAMSESNFANNVLRVGTYTDAAGRAVIEVSDTGSGMGPETLRRIFHPFFTTKSAGVGTGLGLAICHRIVRSFDGEIAVSSELGKGTTFRVILPAAEHDDAVVLPEPAAAPPVAQLVRAGRRARVLVVDDEPLIASLVADALKSEHEVETTTQAMQALAWVREGRQYDVVLCDLMMPQVSGIDLHEKIAELDPSLAKRMVFMTGGAFTAAARDFLSNTENPVVEKPFEPEELCNVVNTLIADSARPSNRLESVRIAHAR
ncbi:MAG TPA: response regulator [Polyangiales bacterium]|jgi:PAS domain S-box-containing protein|nr:response regulator [Polyangiales bacterium]